MDKGQYKKIKLECTICKSKFEIMISENVYSLEMEEMIRKNFYRYCPVCKALEELK